MSARKFRGPPVKVNVIVVPGAANPSIQSSNNPPPADILWLTPQDLADIRLQYEIGEMLAGRRPAQRMARPASADAVRKGSHLTND